MKRSSGGRPAPAPKNTLRTPLRSTRTGTAWSLSVMQRHFRHVGKYARDLSDDADLVDDRLAGLDAGFRCRD